MAQTDDDPSVARSPCLLTDEEERAWAHLIEHRHSYENLVLMCGVHSDIIDDPAQQFSVAQVVQIKFAHEQEVEARVREERAESIRASDSVAESDLARPLVLDDIGSWQRKAVVALARDDRDALYWLRGEIGDPPDPDRIIGLIARWPETVGGRSDLLAAAVIRHAEAIGLWSQAADGWEHYADRTAENSERADRLVRAAIDSQVAGEHDRRERLLGAAEDADPECARLHLERMDSDLSPAEQLSRLEKIHTDDHALSALVACQKAMTSLLLPDLDAAERYLPQAQQLYPDSIANRATAINIEIQRARIALISDQAFSLADALAAQQDALSLRDELVAMGRWSESGRLLMLAADVPGALRDPEGAETVLRTFFPEEASAPDGGVVLGDAALRAGAPTLALEIIEHTTESDAITRIRAAARVDLGGPGRAEGLEALEKLALSDSSSVNRQPPSGSRRAWLQSSPHGTRRSLRSSPHRRTPIWSPGSVPWCWRARGISWMPSAWPQNSPTTPRRPKPV